MHKKCKELLSIKGLSDQKVDKIIEAARKSSHVGFVTCNLAEKTGLPIQSACGFLFFIVFNMMSDHRSSNRMTIK